jgi:hypothetical protein
LEFRSEPYLGREKPSEFRSKQFLGIEKPSEFDYEPFLGEKKPRNSVLNHFQKRKNFGFCSESFSEEKNWGKGDFC